MKLHPAIEQVLPALPLVSGGITSSWTGQDGGQDVSVFTTREMIDYSNSRGSQYREGLWVLWHGKPPVQIYSDLGYVDWDYGPPESARRCYLSNLRVEKGVVHVRHDSTPVGDRSVAGRVEDLQYTLHELLKSQQSPVI